MSYTQLASSVTLIVSSLLLLAGCATQAQRQFEAIKAGNQEHAAQMQACTANVYNSPENEPLRPHLAIKGSDLTLRNFQTHPLPHQTRPRRSL